MYVFAFQAIRHDSVIYSFEFIKVCLRRRRHDIGELKQPTTATATGTGTSPNKMFNEQGPVPERRNKLYQV